MVGGVKSSGFRQSLPRMSNSAAQQSHEHNVHPVYRPDIDGLRAVAILSVVAFHAFPFSLRGGFVGVDVFFVISGFLISNIIFRSLQSGDFSFTEFYAHRIKRIFPALIVVLTACYAFGWFVLFPDEFKHFGQHMAAGAGFIQNFILWREVGYFDKAAELKPLLHLWSLAIEEQFYLIFPVLIFAVWRIGLNVLTVVVLLGLISFGLNIAGVTANSTKTFFMPQTRVWELLAGSVLAYLQFFKRAKFSAWMQHWAFHPILFRHPPESSRRGEVLNNALSVVGLLLLVVAVFLINKSKPFPGWWALMPVSGACFLILAGPEAWGNRVILANKLMVFVGLISYPLYLWHWPILSFARIVEGEMPSWEVRTGAVLLSLVLAWLTYRLIEKPIRFGKRTRFKTFSLSVLLLFVASIGYWTYKNNGIEIRYRELHHLLSQLEGHDDVATACRHKFSSEFCNIAKEGDPTILLVGDSHAWQLFHGLAAETRLSNENVMTLNQGACMGVLGFSNRFDFKACQDVTRKSLDIAINLESVRTVVFAVRPTLFAERVSRKIDYESISPPLDLFISEIEFEAWTSAAFHKLIGTLLKKNKKIVFVVNNPEISFDQRTCLQRQPFRTPKRPVCAEPKEVSMARDRIFREWLNKLITGFPKIEVFDLSETLCDNSLCWGMKDGKMLFLDNNHLSRDGSYYVARKLIKVIDAH